MQPSTLPCYFRYRYTKKQANNGIHSVLQHDSGCLPSELEISRHPHLPPAGTLPSLPPSLPYLGGSQLAESAWLSVMLLLLTRQIIAPWGICVLIHSLVYYTSTVYAPRKESRLCVHSQSGS